MAFVSIGLIELVHSLNIKSDESIFKSGIFENKFLVGAFVLGAFMQVVVVVVPPLAKIFSLRLLNMYQWLIVILISMLPIVIMELQKMFRGANVNFANLKMNYKGNINL